MLVWVQLPGLLVQLPGLLLLLSDPAGTSVIEGNLYVSIRYIHRSPSRSSSTECSIASIARWAYHTAGTRYCVRPCSTLDKNLADKGLSQSYNKGNGGAVSAMLYSIVYRKMLSLRRAVHEGTTYEFVGT